MKRELSLNVNLIASSFAYCLSMDFTFFSCRNARVVSNDGVRKKLKLIGSEGKKCSSAISISLPFNCKIIFGLWECSESLRKIAESFLFNFAPCLMIENYPVFWCQTCETWCNCKCGCKLKIITLISESVSR